MTEQALTTKRERKTSFVGLGCFIQGAGLLAPFLLGAFMGTTGAVIGIVMALILFFVGSAKSSTWRCGNCKNPLADADVRMCPVCKAQIK